VKILLTSLLWLSGLAFPAAALPIEVPEVSVQLQGIDALDVFLTEPPLVSADTGSEEFGADIGQQLDLTEVRAFLEQLDADVQASLPGVSLSRLLDELRTGKVNLNPAHIGKAMRDLLLKELLSCAPLMGKLLILAVLCAVLRQLQVAFAGTVGKTARMMTFLVLLGMIIAVFQTVMGIANMAIDQMTGFMQAIFPVMLTLLVAMGNFTAAALFRPLVLGSMVFLATLLKTVVLPLIFLGAVLHLFNQISPQFQLKRLAGLLDFAGKTGLGLALTIFIGVMTVQGVAGGVADGVMLRTAKYSADVIPVVGKYFKDAVEIVMGSGIVLRNALGLVSVLALLIICAGPAVKIIVMHLVFRTAAALIEPLGEEALAHSLEQTAKSIFLIFAAVASIAVMFFITIIIVVGTGNMTVMLR
jgi:stage III sporulation protein AE